MRAGFLYSVSIITAVAVTSYFLRAFPFLVLNKKNKAVEKYMMYLGKVLPPAVIGILIIFCLKDTSIINSPYGIPEMLAVAIVVLLHVWKRNSLISILGGTVFYMYLVQKIF
ncbi:branched-chain amino acid transporter permease [Fusobacterium varium]|jgi:branched-subunit amino acid transport protein AzlD|uniref:branched-chain amino acid transporter permease n=1 Tax=Fusobacterium varium TaxID=856 RepID=UPI00241C3CFF|nr:AzlD domain-containing protein [Fusobacterium varium]